MNAQQQDIQRHLNEAWDNYQNSKDAAAFERLHCAVVGLFQEQLRIDSAARHAANVASCLANGINPD